MKTQSKMLIEELTPTESNIIQESSQDGKNYWLSGIFMQSEIQNRNGRVYPLSEMTTAVQNMQNSIKESNGCFGELDHPNNLTINLDRVSHVITELYMEGNNAMGRAKLLNTPMGLIAQELSKSGVRYGVSSRGAGNVAEGGGVTGFNLITVDLVATPSAQMASPSSIYETLENNKHGREVLSLAEQLKNDEKAQMYFKKEILKFLSESAFTKIK